MEKNLSKEELEHRLIAKEVEVEMGIVRIRDISNHLEDMRRLVFEGLMPNILPPKREGAVDDAALKQAYRAYEKEKKEK